MKKFMASLLFLFSTSVFAMSESDIYVTENMDGGKIYLFADKCPLRGSEGARISMTFGQGFFSVGCWFVYGDKLYVLWLPEGSDPVKAEYDPEIFRLEKVL